MKRFFLLAFIVILVVPFAVLVFVRGNSTRIEIKLDSKFVYSKIGAFKYVKLSPEEFEKNRSIYKSTKLSSREKYEKLRRVVDGKKQHYIDGSRKKDFYEGWIPHGQGIIYSTNLEAPHWIMFIEANKGESVFLELNDSNFIMTVNGDFVENNN